MVLPEPSSPEIVTRSPVTSPTYTIGHRYEGDPDVSHLDLYRFEGMSNAEWGDLEEYFEDAVVFVEWPEAAAGGLPDVRAAVRLEHVDAESRRIVIEGDVTLGDGADPGLRHRD